MKIDIDTQTKVIAEKRMNQYENQSTSSNGMQVLFLSIAKVKQKMFNMWKKLFFEKYFVPRNQSERTCAMFVRSQHLHSNR